MRLLTRAFMGLLTLVLLAPVVADAATQPSESDGHWTGAVAVAGPAEGPDGWQRLDGAGDPALGAPIRNVAQAAALQREAVQRAEVPDDPGGVSALDAYDYYTLDQCREQYSLDNGQHQFRNHFASCLKTQIKYDHILCTPSSGCRIVGNSYFRFTLIGFGNRGTRTISFVGEVDQPRHVGETHLHLRMGVDLECVALPGADCGRNNTVRTWRSIGEWVANGQLPTVVFDASASAGSGEADPYHHPLDRVSYHELHTIFSNPDQPGTPIVRNGSPFRCDTASYASGGGCIFASVEAVHHVSLAPQDGITEEAAHVLAAQKTPELTKPGVPSLPIPGDPDADPQVRKPLTRLWEGYELGRYDANHATAVTTCRNYWGRDYARGPNGDRDCDEYPFRSTYEGAYFTVLYPNAPWSYSARPIDRSQNRRAGALLGNWYTADHILHGDTFWVKVVGCDGCGGDPGTPPPGNTPPTVDAGADTGGTEGAAITLTGTVTDPDDTPTIAWSYQAGADVDPGAVCRFADPAVPATTITCTDDGTFTVTLTADDHHGEPSPVSDSATVTVTNVAPTATVTAPTPGQAFKAREPVPVTVALTDPGSNDKHTCGATFGDGSAPVAGTVTETDGTGTCTASHTYGFDGLGPRTIDTTVADDDDGATATASVTVVIYVPGHGFALEAAGLVTVARTPDVHCPPDQHKTTAVLNTGVGRVDGLAVTCTVDQTIGRTVVDTTIAHTSLLGGLVRISDVESHCTASAEGITRSSRVGTINGIPIGLGQGSINLPGIATVHVNETTTNANGDLVQNAVRVVKPPLVVGGIVVTPGQEIVLANCRLG